MAEDDPTKPDLGRVAIPDKAQRKTPMAMPAIPSPRRTPPAMAAVPDPESAAPSVQISMGDAESRPVRMPPRRHETMKPYEDDQWTPGMAASAQPHRADTKPYGDDELAVATDPAHATYGSQAMTIVGADPLAVGSHEIPLAAAGSQQIAVIADGTPRALAVGSRDIPIVTTSDDAMTPLPRPIAQHLAHGAVVTTSDDAMTPLPRPIAQHLAHGAVVTTSQDAMPPLSRPLDRPIVKRSDDAMPPLARPIATQSAGGVAAIVTTSDDAMIPLPRPTPAIGGVIAAPAERVRLDETPIPPVVVELEADRPEPRKQLGNYEIIQLIGSGGMAEVFLARHRGPMGFEKVVVLKCIHSHLAREKHFVTMFLDEARLAARINDPRVVQIYELGQSKGTYFMAMEYLEGESLSTLVKHALRAQLHVPLGHVMRIVADVAAGLHAAHELRDSYGRALEVVHRDVSHGNIVILYSGTVKVLDFGVAKARDSLTKTTAGERKGKYGYMSPEQVLGEPLDRRSDVFSLGVVLWEVLTRKSLFVAETETQAFRRILEGVAPPPSTLRPDIPAELDAICLRALAKDRRHRYQSAEEMALALERVMKTAATGTSALELAAYMKQQFADRVSARTRLLRVNTQENTPIPIAEIHHTESRVVAADRAVEQLEQMHARGRRRMIIGGIAIPLLVAGAYLFGRRDEPAAAPERAVAPIVTPPPASVIDAPARERGLADSVFDRAELAIRAGKVASPPGDNALELVLEAEQLEPASPRGKAIRADAVKQLLAYADTLWHAGKLDSARTLYADILLFEPDNALAKQRLVVDKPAATPQMSRDVAWLVTEIDLAIIERRLVAPDGRNALELLVQLRRVDPRNEATRRLGGEVTSAIKAEAQSKPGNAKLQAAAKKLAMSTDRTDGDKSRDPSLAKEWIGRGNKHLGSGRLGEARIAFERAVTADSGAHAALAGLAEVAYNESDFTRAVLAAKRAIALAPAAGGYRMLLGKAYYKLLRYDDAIRQWQKALELDPKNAAAQKNIEMAQRRMGR